MDLEQDVDHPSFAYCPLPTADLNLTGHSKISLYLLD